jgi:hypothetical protein
MSAWSISKDHDDELVHRIMDAFGDEPPDRLARVLAGILRVMIEEITDERSRREMRMYSIWAMVEPVKPRVAADA